MSGLKKETPCGVQADTGKSICLGATVETTATTTNVALTKGRAKHNCTNHITFEGGEPFTIYAKGCEAWALDRLRWAGANGCTPIEQPAPRWNAYVHTLRERGVPIETIYEPHAGEFSGTHGRYVLRADVRKGGGI